MFPRLGTIVCKTWPAILLVWIGLLACLVSVAPKWNDVVQDGEFAFLPEDVPSRQSETAFKRAFPEDAKASTIVIVLLRDPQESVKNKESGPDGLEPGDLKFITDILVPELEAIAERHGGLASVDEDSEQDPDDDPQETAEQSNGQARQPSIISRIRTFDDRSIGGLLQSADNKATLVYVELTTEFLEYGNRETIEEVEALIAPDGEQSLRQRRLIPPGLDISISGSATVGRDMRRAQSQSASATENWTIILVLGLLILIYRAPLLAVIPLLTVGFATTISIKCLSLLAAAGLVTLFDGIEVYVTVLVYGAGVDYCLFLIARYKEELDSSATYNEAIANSLGKVGAALTASAGTVMCGIGMMIFAEFGKFRQAGVAITFSLFICLCAALTFTPSLLRLSGRWAFWPKMRTERLTGNGGWISATSLMARLMRQNWLNDFWQRVARTLLAWPGRIWVGSILLLLPFAVIAVMCFSYLSYGLLAELPQTEASVVGAKAIQSHFPAGYVDPTKILLINED
ncbi:MAG: MMPL family transporter, partial [Planctomycetaceae bacterium]